MSCPSSVIVPVVGSYHRSTRPMMVLFPEPLGPCGRVSSNFSGLDGTTKSWPLPAGTYNKSGNLPRGDSEGEVFQDRDIAASRVTKADPPEVDGATRIIRLASRLVKRVDLGLSIDQSKELFRGRCRSGEYNEMRADRRDGSCGNDDGEQHADG
jgi:hypothetical protein